MNAVDINGFCDLNITFNPEMKLLERILDYDYRAVALNWTVDVSKHGIQSFSKKKKNSSPDTSDLIVYPKQMADSFKDIISKYFRKLKVFLRITIIFEKPEQLKLVLNSTDIKKYDLIAVLPTTHAAYQHACVNQSVDLISFEIGVTNYRPNRKLHKQLIDRCGYFEISYAQALKSSVKRQEIFTMAQYFNIYCKSKNAIITSGAQHYLELRNPYDVANLALLFGLREEQAKCAISRNCRLLLLTSVGKRYGKSAIVVELNEPEEEEPSKKRSRLDTNNDNVSEVTDNISSLTTTELK